MTAGTVTVTETPLGEPPSTRIPSRADLTTAAFVAPNGTTLEATLAACILGALGKVPTVNGRARHSFDDVVLAPLWLTAHETETLYVASPQGLSTRALRLLAGLTASSATSLVLVCDHGTSTRVLDALVTHGARTEPIESFPDLEAPTDDEGHSSAAPTAVDRGFRKSVGAELEVPYVEFPTFLHECQFLLSSTRFAEVESHYRSGHAEATDSLDTEPPSEEMARQLLSTIATRNLTTSDAICAARGMQMAFFEAGWLLRIDIEKLWSTLEYRRTPAPTQEEWERLRAYRDPVRAATVALYLLGLTPANIEEVTVHHIASFLAGDASSLGLTSISSAAVPYLQCQLLARAIDGAEATDSYLRSNARRVSTDLNAAVKDLGFVMPTGRFDSSANTRLDWHRKLGFVLEDLR